MQPRNSEFSRAWKRKRGSQENSCAPSTLTFFCEQCCGAAKDDRCYTGEYGADNRPCDKNHSDSHIDNYSMALWPAVGHGPWLTPIASTSRREGGGLSRVRINKTAALQKGQDERSMLATTRDR